VVTLASNSSRASPRVAHSMKQLDQWVHLNQAWWHVFAWTCNRLGDANRHSESAIHVNFLPMHLVEWGCSTNCDSKWIECTCIAEQLRLPDNNLGSKRFKGDIGSMGVDYLVSTSDQLQMYIMC
jgi:hypothetical protein